MIIYNITTKVHILIADEWLIWLKEIHAQEIMGTGLFTKFLIVQLIETDDTDEPTYAVQFFAESKALYNIYAEKFAGEMRTRAFNKWGDNFISIRTLMQIVS
jgi:hypothetical protein